jgi:Ca2+-binding RTX toxin-like protein
MKMTGSNFNDSLFGTGTADLIIGNGGNDLISAGGQAGKSRDEIHGGDGKDLISGFSLNVDDPLKSQSRGSIVDGGTGYDSLILDLTAHSKTVMVANIQNMMKISKIEDIIYNLSGISDKQTVQASGKSETVYVGENNARAYGNGGDDFLFSGMGDDMLSGGAGRDFLSAGDGHNVLTGGAGKDYFMFEPDDQFEYTNITDFKSGQDKIAVILHVDLSKALAPDRYYGNSIWELGQTIDANGYLDYDHGRYFEQDDFKRIDGIFGGTTVYERSTGSVVIRMQNDEGKEREVLIAHVDGNPKLEASDFVYMIL